MTKKGAAKKVAGSAKKAAGSVRKASGSKMVMTTGSVAAVPAPSRSGRFTPGGSPSKHRFSETKPSVLRKGPYKPAQASTLAKVIVKPTPVAAALLAFEGATTALGLQAKERSTLLNVGRTKLFSVLKDPDPKLDVDQRDRLGYFLGIYELSGRLVGSAVDWLKAPNKAPIFKGKPPLERLLDGRMESLFITLNYLKGAYGGWA